MNESYADLLRERGLEPELRGPWALFGRSAREQGWKLHISSTPSEAADLVSVLAPILEARRVPFKLARDEGTLFLLNEGELGATQIGKFVTIYPPNDALCRELATELAAATARFSGPVVTTDLRVAGIVYARYGGFNPAVLRDRLGHVMPALRLPDGSLLPDHYTVPFAVPQGVENPFADIARQESPGPMPDAGSLFGPGYRLLTLLKANAKGSVFLALDLRSQQQLGLKVIKEGRRHCLSDRLGRDIRARLRHQQALHERLADHLPVPRVDAYFEVAGNDYLVLDHVEGQDIGARPAQPFHALPVDEQRRLLSELENLASAVGALHAAGVVHRDLTPSNIRVADDGTVFLLDLELAHVIGGDAPPFSQGTPGFMSPQQEARHEPAPSDDVYALGALAILLLGGLDPRRVLFAVQREREPQLRALTGAPSELIEVVAHCVDESPERRPALADLRQALSSATRLSAPARLRPAPPSVEEIRREAAGLRDAMVAGLLHDVLLDQETGLWLSPLVRSGRHEPAERAAGYALHRSASRGVAGVVYMLARFARCGCTDAALRPRVEQAVDWLLTHAPTSDDQLPGLHFGEAGVAVAIAEAVRAGLIDRGAWLATYLGEALQGPLDWPDVTHGAAGQGLAALACADALADAELAARAGRCADFLIETQDSDGGWSWPAGVEGMAGTRYTGFAHGVAGVVWFLAEYGARFAEPSAEQAARAGAEWLLTQALRPGGDSGVAEWPMKEVADERWRWWCHGGPGIALAFLRMFEVTRDPRYAEIARSALETHPLDLRHSNLSQCHGLAGLGEIYLQAWRILGDERWLARATRVGDILLRLRRESARGGLTWLVEDPFKATGDLMVGCAGIAHFLLRLSTPAATLGFPLLPDGVPAADAVIREN